MPCPGNSCYEISMPRIGISKWHYVYVLQSQKDEDLYVGYTRDLLKRLHEHNAKRNFSTAPRSSFVLIYAEACLNEEDAKRREDYLKTSQGHRFLKLRLRKFLKSD